MKRTEWLKQMRQRAEALYDRLSPQYWVTFGFYPNETHRIFLKKFLDRMAPGSVLLSAACGAGRYDGMLLEAGHKVVGIDQSAGMLARARERFPGARYEKIGLQEMDFHAVFDGAVCIDAMEHVFPEDWPGILCGFREALKPGGWLYFTVELAEGDAVAEEFRRAKEKQLPVVFGEAAAGVEEAFQRAAGMPEVPGELAAAAVYHYYPPLEQVRTWIGNAGLVIEEEGTGNEYEHFLVKKI